VTATQHVGSTIIIRIRPLRHTDFLLFPFSKPNTYTQTTSTTPTTGSAASPGLTFVTDKAGDFVYQVADKAPANSGTPPEILQDAQMGIAVAAGGLEGLPADSCLAADFDELKDAVEVRSVSRGCQTMLRPPTKCLTRSFISSYRMFTEQIVWCRLPCAGHRLRN